HRRQQQQSGEQGAPEGEQRAAQVFGPIAEEVGLDEQPAAAPEHGRQENAKPSDDWPVRRRNRMDCRIAHLRDQGFTARDYSASAFSGSSATPPAGGSPVVSVAA